MFAVHPQILAAIDSPNAAAWYRKQEPTFSDAIAAVRRDQVPRQNHRRRQTWAPSVLDSIH
jgi:hypothetical protein